MKRTVSLSSVRLDRAETSQRPVLEEVSDRDIAIIGLAAQLPGGADREGFWEGLAQGLESVAELSPERKRDIEEYLRFRGAPTDGLPFMKGAFLPAIDGFDYGLFHITPKEASLMHPAQRLFLETAYAAFEDAGYPLRRLSGSRTGVYLGLLNDPESYKYREMVQAIDPADMPMATSGNLVSIFPSRVSYLFNLKGPSLVIDTACSSSLVALHLACQALRNGECDMALAGGARVLLFPVHREEEKVGFESSDERTYTFDESADGSGAGEGVLAFVLKPLHRALRDGDHIHAVVKGSATNQDGTSMGITAPNPESQADVLTAAWRDAGVDPETISYIETHGTGTRLGDPIEVEGLENAFRRFTDKRQFCAIGSVKTNIGHLYASAGLAGALKAILAMQHGALPPHLHFHRPNTRINFSESPVYVNRQLAPWEPRALPRRCGVSSFGLSGTNCHVVLEEAPRQSLRANPPGGGLNALVLSARSAEALGQLVERYCEALERNPALDLRSVCFTASTGREHHTHRLAIQADDLGDLRAKLACLLGADLEGAVYPWLSYGEHRVVTAYRDALGEGELTAADREQLTERGWEVLGAFLESGQTDRQLLAELCGLYVSGAAIEWEQVYRGESLRRVSLPTYPFERKRCWLSVPGAVAAAAAGEPARTGSLSGLYYRRTWKQEALARQAEAPAQGAVLLVAEPGTETAGLANALKAAGRHVITSAVGAGSEADYRQLLETAAGQGVTQVVHLLAWSDRQEPADLAVLEASQERGLLSLLRLVKAVPSGASLGFTVVTCGVHQVTADDRPVSVQHAGLPGLANVIRKEYPGMECRCVDLDAQTPLAVLAEELRWGAREPHVAYRQGARYVEQFGLAPAAPQGATPPAIRTDGVYLVTGGLGGIGLELARDLVSRRSGVRIALLGRSGLPPRSEWEGMLAARRDARACRAIEAIQAMEVRGAEICPVRADVADPEQMAAVVADLRARYGPIRGVIHAAGVGRSTLLAERSEADFRALLAPKVAGAWILDRLTRQDRPDLFVLCSSVASVFSAAMQGDYAAANAFLDGFAAYRSAQGLPTLSLNWTTWKETGMAVDNGIAFDTMFKVLPTARALACFGEALARPEPCLLIGELNLEGGGPRLMQNSGVRLTAELAGLVAQFQANRAPRSAAPAPALTAGPQPSRQVRLLGRQHEEYTATERLLAEICRETLGFEQVDVHENFFEMGADSIALTRMAKRLDERFPGRVQVTDLFQYATISKLAQFLVASGGEATGPQVALPRAASGDIAIIGMAAKLPHADTLEEFWRLINGGVSFVRSFPPERRADVERFLAFKGVRPEQVGYLDGAYLTEIDKFDHGLFRIPPKEARFIDPHQRLFLETAWHAMEDAGYGGGKLAGTQTGVYFGFTTNVRDMYSRILYDIDPALLANAIVGNSTAVVAGRISYMLDLRGPAMVLDTACSSGLVALDAACQAIRSGRCEAALVGGIKLITMPTVIGSGSAFIGMDSHDAITRTFDHHAQGTAFGEGVEVVLVKSLEKAQADGDHIYAVIKGIAVNQDGTSAGVTAPNPEAQVDVLLRAWADAGIDPETLSYIEAHGTATPLGDPIEINSLIAAFRKHTDKRHFCAVGSVKSNTGHLSEGAGLVGLIKCVLAMKHGELPGNLHFNRPSSHMNFVDSPVYVNARRRKWVRGQTPRRCGVSAFGLSGTNGHVVLEEYIPPAAAVEAAALAAGPHLLALSARTPEALERLVEQYRTYCDQPEMPALADLCYTANTGRGHYAARLALLVEDAGDLRRKLDSLAPGNLRAPNEPGVSFGEHRIVPEEKEARAPGELTEAERHELTAEAGRTLDRYLEQGKATRELLAELGALYVRGAEVNWDLLYQGEAHQKRPLPLYPFERTRCWVDVPAAPEAAEADPDALYYHVAWKPKPIAMGGARRRSGAAVVLGEPGEPLAAALADRLRAAGTPVIEARLGGAYARTGEHAFTLSGSEADYQRFLAETKEQNVSLVLQLHGLSARADHTNLKELDGSLERGVYSTMHLVRALGASDLAGHLDLYLVAPDVHAVTGLEERIVPANGALFGLGKAISHEQPHIRCRAVDIDALVTAEDLLAELGADGQHYAVAYRNGVRYVEEFQELPDVGQPQQPVTIKPGGVYLITGGLGGIGQVMARHLAGQGPVRLALVNRTRLPGRDEWEGLLAARTDEGVCQRIEAIRHLEAAGAEVCCYAADVARHEEIEPLIADIHRRWGRIDGVLHAAGAVQPGVLLLKSEETVRQVLAPKVQGTWLLDQLTAADAPDFFLLFSSAVTLTGEAGMGDYMAANYFLDAYAAHRNRQGRPNTLAINWTSWAEAGMSVRFGINVDTIFKALPTAQAVRAFDELVGRPVERVVVGQFNYAAAREFLGLAGALPFDLSDRFLASVQRAAGQTRGGAEPVSADSAFVPLSTRRKMERAAARQEVTLKGREGSEYNEVEAKVAQIYSEILGFSDINIYDSFFELGGDSILLSRMHVRLEQEFPGQVKLVELFDHTSVSKLAQYLIGKTQPKAPPAKPQSDEELDAELNSLLDMMQSGQISVDQAIRSLKKLEE